MNITKNSAGNCQKTCEFSFQYPLTNFVVQNRGNYISLRPKSQMSSSVTYNNERYDIKDVKLFQPSVHKFGGVRTEAELMIDHISTSGSGRLMVCVPIKQSIVNNQQRSTLDKLISYIGEKSTSDNVTKLSLNALVPTKPYLTYEGKIPVMRDMNYEVIVFDKSNSLTMSSTGHKKLQNLIRKTDYDGAFVGNDPKAKPKLYYNKSGPNKYAENANEIYIDCQPTGHSGETIIEQPLLSEPSYTLNETIDFNKLRENYKTIFSMLLPIGYIILSIILITIVSNAFPLIQNYLLSLLNADYHANSMMDIPPS